MFIKPKNALKVRDNMIKVESKEDLDAQLKANKKVLAVFTSTWCPYCNRFLPTFSKNIEGKGFQNIINVILDDDDDPLWDDYAIAAVPTVIYFEDGKVANRLDAMMGLGLTESALQNWLQKFSMP